MNTDIYYSNNAPYLNNLNNLNNRYNNNNMNNINNLSNRYNNNNANNSNNEICYTVAIDYILPQELRKKTCIPVPQEYTCVVCMDAKKTHAYNICGHLCVCKSCGDRCIKCPMCRAEGQLIKIIM